MRNSKLITCLLTVSCLLLTPIADARMYRYKDDNGRLVISNTVPQEASTRGYEIINSQGRVIKKIDPAPTDEELQQRDDEKRQQEAAREQRIQDAALLRRYSQPDDAVRALHRKIRELEGITQLKRGNISVIESQLDTEQSRAADLERSGKKIPDSTLVRIDRLQNQIQDIEAEIEIQDAEMENLRRGYLSDIERLEEITDHDRTLTIDPPDEKPSADRTRTD